MRQNLRDHVVVIGFGRVGRSAADAALHTGHDCVVIDTDPASEQAVESMGAVFLHGDARDVTVLRHANVAHAAALITTLEDPSNAVVSLTARSLSPTLRIVARVADVTWSERLLRAGASHVVPVYESIGAGLAATALDAATGRASVGLVELDQKHPFANINLTDNIVRFVTSRYDKNPLVVQGPGAGPAVTAGGVFADLLRVCAYLGAKL